MLLERLLMCDTSNPPGHEAQAAAVIEDYARARGLQCERIAKDPERPNVVVRLPGRGTGPSLAFLGHLDVVPARREEWSVEPFAAIRRGGAIWGRGAVDMKCQVAATTVALAHLAGEGFRPTATCSCSSWPTRRWEPPASVHRSSSTRRARRGRILWSVRAPVSDCGLLGGRSTSWIAA